MLIIVVLLFGLCWFPLQLYQTLQVTFESINEYRYINIVWFCSDWLAMSNSCYNPFIYGIYNEKFKREFQRRFPVFRPGRPDGPSEASDQTVSVYTRASSVRSSSHHMHSNGAQRKALAAASASDAATQRSCSFNFIGKTSADIRLEDASGWTEKSADSVVGWCSSGVNNDLVTNQNGQNPARSYPKVMFQPVPGSAPPDDVATALTTPCRRCAAPSCECFDKPKRYSEEYVQL